jgi:flagellin-like protein
LSATCISGSERNEAVSPILGTLLMVAITIVLAGVIFVVVQGLGHSTDAPAQLTLVVKDAQDRAVVQATAGGPRWDEIDIRMSAPGGWAVNSAAATGFAAGVWVQAGGDHIYPSHYLDVCLDMPGGDLILEVRHTDPTLGVTTLTFTNVGSC